MLRQLWTIGPDGKGGGGGGKHLGGEPLLRSDGGDLRLDIGLAGSIRSWNRGIGSTQSGATGSGVFVFDGE